MRNLIFILISSMFVQPILALTPEAEAGKQLFVSCNACHNPDLNPPLAPPMFAVQKRYKREAASKTDFIEKIVAFSSKPTKEAAVFKMAVNKMGLMPSLGFPKENLHKIATFIYETEFGYPCGHWKAGMEQAKKAGDMNHYNQDKKKLERFCSDVSTTQTISNPKVSMKPLKDVMSELGDNFSTLNAAILAEDFDKIATSAHDIAFHPQVLPQQKKKLKGFFGKEMMKFKQTDMSVHKISAEIETAANQKDMTVIIRNQGKLLQACMDCHQTFRKRAIQVLQQK